MTAPVVVPIAEIRLGKRLRAIDPKQVAALAESISDIGLRTPISVMWGERFEDGRTAKVRILVAGHHRLEAMKKLGRAEIECFEFAGDEEHARLWEVEENLIRAELSDAERALHHAEHKRILEELGIVRTHGGDRKSSGRNGHLKSYSEEAAERTGKAARTIRQDVQRGEKVAPEVLNSVVGTEMDRGSIIDQLVKIPPDEQAEWLRKHKEKAAKLAREPKNDFEVVQTQLDALNGAWNRAGPEAREKFLAGIDRPTFDRTRSGRAA